MSMLTPRGMGGQYKITGKLYPRMVRRRRKTPIVIGALMALVVLATGGWAVYHYTSNDGHKTAAACAKASPSASASHAATPAALHAPTLPAPNAITVNVYNATTRQGLAKGVADELKARGFIIGQVTNYPDKTPIPGPGLVKHGFPGTDPATVVAAQIPGVQQVDDGRTTDAVDLVLGDGYQAMATPDQATAALAPPAPAPSTPAKC